MRREAGLTLPELLIVIAVAALVLVATAAYSVPWIAREAMRSAVYDVQTALQTARIEAVSRNHDCRFTIDTATSIMNVIDTMGTAGTGDDQVLREVQVSSSVTFARPDVGTPVTLTPLGGTLYGATFNSEGSVTSGTGEIVLFGGNRYGKISLFAAGGVNTERWNGSAWEAGL